MTRRVCVGRFVCAALNSPNVCPRSSCTASQSLGPGFGIGSKLLMSGVKARWRTADNSLRSPIASRIVFSSGGVKAIAIADSNTVIAAIVRIRRRRLSEFGVQKSAVKVGDSEVGLASRALNSANREMFVGHYSVAFAIKSDKNR